MKVLLFTRDSCIARMFLGLFMFSVLPLFPSTIPISSSKMLCPVFNGLDRVVSRGIPKPLYNELYFGSHSKTSYNTTDCMSLIVIAVEALLESVPLNFRRLDYSLVSYDRWVSFSAWLVHVQRDQW